MISVSGNHLPLAVHVWHHFFLGAPLPYSHMEIAFFTLVQIPKSPPRQLLVCFAARHTTCREGDQDD